MTIRILTILIPALVAFSGTAAFAGELDNESTVVNQQALRAKDLPQTVVVRVNTQTGEASVLESKDVLAQDARTVAAVHSEQFKKLESAGPAELNRDSSTSSWFAWYPRGYYSAPIYYYAGYNYPTYPCFSYPYGGFQYIWYRWY